MICRDFHKRIRIARCIWMIALVTISLPLYGCVKLFDQPPNYTSTDQIGTVHVTVYPPIAYDALRADLQPVFKMSTDTALKEVLPVTRGVIASALHSNATSAAASLPTDILSSTKKTDNNNGMITTTEQRTETKTSGEVPSTSAQASNIIEQPESTSDLSKSTVDPFTKYAAATALYQETHLLDRLYKDMDFGDYVPYVVRLQVSLFPYVRNIPYDAYCDMTFFIKNQDTLPKVLPILVTDDLESTDSRLTDEKIFQLTLALKGMVNSIGFGVSNDTKEQLLKTIVGRDINPLFTVGRLSDNCLRARISASQQAGIHYALVGRTVQVTTLLLVHKNAMPSDRSVATLDVVTHTTFRHATDAFAPFVSEEIDANTLLDEIGALFKIYKVNLKPSETEILNDSAGVDDYKSFKEELSKIIDNIEDYTTDDNSSNKSAEQKVLSSLGALTIKSLSRPDLKKQPNRNNQDVFKAWKDDVTHMLWLDTKRIMSTSAYDRTTVSFSTRRSGFDSKMIERAKQEKQYLYDGDKTATVSIQGLGRPQTSTLIATLVVFDSGTQKKFAAKSLKMDEAGSGIVATFDSCATWIKKPTEATYKLELRSITDESENYTFDLVHSTPPAQEVKTVTTQIVSRNGNDSIAIIEGAEGSVLLIITKYESSEQPILVIDGARVDEIVPETIAKEEQKAETNKAFYQILANGQITIKLSNLKPGQEVKLSVITNDVSKSDKALTFTCVASNK